MTINHLKEAPAPEAVDDLTRIKGIGHVVENRLNRAGIHTFAQLAATSPKRISKLLADMIGMTPEKIKEQDWIGQARRLASESQKDETFTISVNLDNRQHYETFSVKLLEDVSNRVRRTNIVHVQKGVEQNWAGWDEQRLIAFIVENAKLNLASTENNASHNLRNAATINPSMSAFPTEAGQAAAGQGNYHRHRVLTITSLNVFKKGNRFSATIIPTNQDWFIGLEWTLSGSGPLFGNWLIKGYLESMGPGKEYILPDEDGMRLSLIGGAIKAPDVYSYSSDLNFHAGQIEPGIYWLVVTIAWEKHPGRLGELMQVSKKMMLQFYAPKIS